jgi:enoyl-[acyl-carrier protein] reductase III
MSPAQLIDLSGKHALVTGASRGIGAAIARELAGAGAHVWINYSRDEDGARSVKAQIEGRGGRAHLARANLVHADEIRSMMGGLDAGLDILVHNAAIGSFKPTFDVRTNQWDLSIGVNARALLVCAQQAAPLMEGRDAIIVAISSLGSIRVVPSYGAIGVSKAALEALVRYLAVDLAPRGIRVNAVSAGVVDTGGLQTHPHRDELVAHAARAAPAGRVGDPQDVARVVLFLCSPFAAWIVGQTIVADGGLSLRL